MWNLEELLLLLLPRGVLGVFALLGILAVGKILACSVWGAVGALRTYVWARLWGKSLPETYGKWAVVTGSTDGIGKSYAKELAKKGMNILLVARNMEKLQKVAEEIRSKSGVQTDIVQADFALGRPIYDNIAKRLKGKDIGILVNNVGMLITPGPFEKLTEDNIWAYVNVNVASVVAMTRLVLPELLRRRQGAVVNVSSMGSYFPVAYFHVYAASKKSVFLLTTALSFANPALAAHAAHAAHAATIYSKVGVGVWIEEYVSREFLATSDIQCALLSYVNGIRTLSTQEIRGAGVKCFWLDLTFDPQEAGLETSVGTYTIWSAQALNGPTKTTVPPHQPATDSLAPAATETKVTTPAAKGTTSTANRNALTTTETTTMPNNAYATTASTEPATKIPSTINPATTSTTVATTTTTPMQMNLFLSSQWVDNISGAQAEEICASEGGVPASIKYKAQVDFMYSQYDIDGDGVWVELRRGDSGTRWYDNTLYRDTELNLLHDFPIEDPRWGDFPRNCHRLTGFNHFKVLNCHSDNIYKSVVCARVDA